MAKQETFRDKFYTKIAPIITGLGASVVIIGALFKIQHWEGAGPMLIIGLGTEAVLFALFAFAPAPHEPEWARVYPQLDDEYWAKNGGQAKAIAAPGEQKSVVKSIDEMMNQAKIDQTMVDRLGQGFKSLTDSVGKMGEIANASVATKSYAENVSKAAGALQDMNNSYAATVKSMSEMASATSDAKAFHTQVQNVTKNLGALNAVYEMEVTEANKQLKAMNDFNTGLSSAMSNMQEAGKGAEQFKSEMGKLTGNLTNLNNVYGNMLSAMRGGNAVASNGPAMPQPAAK
jgi:gliding motility-associated protein GldL